MMTEDEIRKIGVQAQRNYFRDETSREASTEFGYWQFAELILDEEFPEPTEAEIWDEDDDV